MSEAVPVIVLNWNGWLDSAACVRSVRSAVDAPVWLVDNGSERDETRAIHEAAPGCRIVQLDENYG